MNFRSQFFETADELAQARVDASAAVKTRRDRLKIIRRFSNGLATMTPEQAKALGRKEITNHLTTYSKLLGQESAFQSMVTGTNSLTEIIVGTGDPERDLVTGVRMAKIINEGAIHHKGRFQALWKKVSGEIVMAGGTPVTNKPRYGWLPRMSLDMVFPAGTELDAEGVTYAFEPMEMTYGDLKEMLASVKGEKGKVLDIANIRALIRILKTQIKDRTKPGNSFSEDDVTGNARNSGGLNMQTIKVDAWAYYEVKYRENGTSYVSKTVFADPMQQVELDEDGDAKPGPKNLTGDDLSAARIISHVEEAYQDAFEWLHMVTVDSEIGGDKDTDSQRGVAELMYPSGSEIEDLLNLLLEGDKIRARPKMKATSRAKTEDVLKWDIEQDILVPDGVEEFELKSNSQHLQTPISMLDRNAASISGAPVSNNGRGGELRVQQQERQESNVGIQINRLSVAYNHLDSILETIVWRLLAGPVKPGTEGYQETMWVRSKLTEAGIDYQKLSEREHGRFKWIRVRAARTIGNGDRQQQIETSDWMMKNIQSVEPASRPIILQRAFALRTGDPDLAEIAIRPPQVILNQQRVIAENEFDTICRRAMIGQALSPQPDDIHHNHIQTHLLDLQALIGQDELEPWGMKGAVRFAAVTQHINEHITILLSNPDTNYEGQRFVEPLQALVSQAKPIMMRVKEEQEERKAGMSPEAQAKLEIEVAKLELAARKLGLAERAEDHLERNRDGRAAAQDRKQFVSEIDSAKRFELEEKKLQQKAAAPAKKKKP